MPSTGSLRWFALWGLPAQLLLCGCSSDVNPIKAAYIDAGYGPKAVPAPDFVEASRRDGIGYMTVGEDAPKRASRARSAEGRKALEAELDAARSRNEARGRAAGGPVKAAKPSGE